MFPFSEAVLKKKGNVLFNDALNTYLITVMDHRDYERLNMSPLQWLLFLISIKGSFIHTIPQTG